MNNFKIISLIKVRQIRPYFYFVVLLYCTSKKKFTDMIMNIVVYHYFLYISMKCRYKDLFCTLLHKGPTIYTMTCQAIRLYIYMASNLGNDINIRVQYKISQSRYMKINIKHQGEKNPS